MERYDELDTLLEEHEGDGTAAWTYTQALAAFRDSGDSGRSRRVLAMAMKSNRHVPALLLRRTKLPRRSDDYITLGGKDEAIEYVREFAAPWERTPGAVAWLRDTPSGLPEPESVERP